MTQNNSEQSSLTDIIPDIHISYIHLSELVLLSGLKVTQSLLHPSALKSIHS